MGLGTPVCAKCFATGHHDPILNLWYCNNCKSTKLELNLFSCPSKAFKLICSRGTLNRAYGSLAPMQMPVQKFDNKIVRSFRVPNGDPNDHYRPWLEDNIGKQKLAWDWELDPNDHENFLLYIEDAELATLFVITWP